MPAVMTTKRLRHRDQGEQHALVGGRLHHIGGEAGRMIADIDREHQHEEREGEQRAAMLGEADSASPFIGRGSRRALGRLVGDVEGAADQRALGDLVADQHALDRAVVEHEHAVAAADQLVVVGGIEDDRRAGIGELAQQLIDLLLGADVDAAGRVVEQDDARRRPSAIWR